jgi:hypothetical protein
MLSSFETGLRSGSAPSPLLPLTHGTTLVNLEAIVLSVKGGRPGVIEPQPCPVFHKALIYTFYARPAYLKGGNDYVSDPAGLPVFLVLAGELVDSSPMVYPFDTGRYALYPFSALLNMSDFRLRSGRNSIGSLIDTFYDSDMDYYWIRPRPQTFPPATPQPVLGYHNMLTTAHPRPEDGRESSIEVAFDKPIPLNGRLKLALVPMAIGSMTDLRPSIEALGCQDVSYYHWTSRYRRSDFRQYLWQRLADHLRLAF